MSIASKPGPTTAFSLFARARTTTRKEGATLSLAQFSTFCNDSFHLRSQAGRLPEYRKKPQIPMATIFLLMVGSLALKKKSFHQIDLFARQPEVRRWLGSDREMVASDCTLWRVLPRMDRGRIREELQQANVLLRQQGHGKILLPGGREIRAAAVDGSTFGGKEASVLERLGAHAAVLDLEPSPGHGHELATSRRVLLRAAQRHGPGFVDIVLGDGLHMTEGMLRLCRQDLQTHLLVKTQELDTLLILQDAEALFRSAETASAVEHVRGTDSGRGMAYELWAAGSFHHGTFADPLKVARMTIRPLKGPRKGQPETWWIVTTDLTLSAPQMRELAHQRWSIENHTFRALNAHMNSKHVWTRGAGAAETFEALMLLMALAFTLVLAYHAHLDRAQVWESYRLRRVTLGYVAECLALSLQGAAGLFSPEG